MKYEIVQADILEWCESYEGPPFHAVLCDAPYHLTTITKRLGKDGSAKVKYGRDGAFQRVSGGFMGQEWDGTMISFQPETWEAIGQHLYPGAFLMTFAGSRTFHRIACAVEDGGMIIHPMIGHIQGQGFPKSTRIDTQITNGKEVWQGHRYGLQSMKPSLEPICLAQKPYEGRSVDCITTTGAGTLWIDGARIGTDATGWNRLGEMRAWRQMEGREDIPPQDSSNQVQPSGRWPANFTLSHTEQCKRVGTRKVKGMRQGSQRGNADFRGGARKDLKREEYPYADEDGLETIPHWDCAPECPIRKLDEEVGERKTNRIEKPCPDPEIRGHKWGTLQGNRGARGYSDQGGVSRFYHNSDWTYEIEERLAGLDLPFKYCPKAGRKERDTGLDTTFPMQLGPEIGVRTIEPGTQGGHSGPRRNNHPTIKPIKLTAWLATLLLPPPEYAPRRILVPFAGTGSEMIGCLLAGWDEVIGVEISEDYCTIAEARLAYWSAQPQQKQLL